VRVDDKRTSLVAGNLGVALWPKAEDIQLISTEPDGPFWQGLGLHARPQPPTRWR
jgi:hypothetical protein